MILSAKGESFKYKGKSYTIGEQIIANNKSAYDGLVGIITEIRDGKDKETGNSAPDIYCSFTPPIFPDDIAALERKFSMLYKQPKELKEIVLDCVIMSPEMITSTNEFENTGKKITVYSLVEEWAHNDNYGFSSELYTNLDDAIREFKYYLALDANNGIVSELKEDGDCFEDIGVNSYECYIDGRYCEAHYAIKVEKKQLYLSDVFIGLIADMKISEARVEDYISQIQSWEELKYLSDEQYTALIQNPNLPDLIQNALDKNDAFSGAYWDSISEIGHQMIYKAVQSVNGGKHNENSKKMSS